MKKIFIAFLLVLAGCSQKQKLSRSQIGQVEMMTSGYRSEARSFQECMQGPNVTENSAGDDNHFTGCAAHDYDFDGDVDMHDFVYWQTLDPNRTPDMVDSWLVLYNRNSPESEQWKNWYIARWGIPAENTFGLDVSTAEKVDIDHYYFNIYMPVRNHLRNNPDLNRKIMGMIVGYNVPGNFDMKAPWSSNPDNRVPRMDGGGGYSVSNALMNMSFIPGPYNHHGTNYRTFPTGPNKHFSNIVVEDVIPVPNRFTLGAGYYLTARLDGPSLEQVKALTPAQDEVLLNGRYYYDAVDPTYGMWNDFDELKDNFPTFYWQEFNSDTEGTPYAAFRCSWHSIVNWDERVWEQNGPRFLAMEHNSFGATTVRSTTDHNNRFVPVALFIGGYKAAMGATAEPLLGTLHDPNTLWYHLIEKERLGVAAFMANPHFNWMWELIGDPLVKVKFPILAAGENNG